VREFDVHAQASDHFDEYVEKLQAPEFLWLADHLKVCNDCGRKFESFQREAEFFKDLFSKAGPYHQAELRVRSGLGSTERIVSLLERNDAIRRPTGRVNGWRLPSGQCTPMLCNVTSLVENPSAIEELAGVLLDQVKMVGVQAIVAHHDAMGLLSERLFSMQGIRGKVIRARGYRRYDHDKHPFEFDIPLARIKGKITWVVVDVVYRGTLVSDLVQQVEDAGAVFAGVLSIVDTGHFTPPVRWGDRYHPIAHVPVPSFDPEICGIGDCGLHEIVSLDRSQPLRPNRKPIRPSDLFVFNTDAMAAWSTIDEFGAYRRKWTVGWNQFTGVVNTPLLLNACCYGRDSRSKTLLTELEKRVAERARVSAGTDPLAIVYSERRNGCSELANLLRKLLPSLGHTRVSEEEISVRPAREDLRGYPSIREEAPQSLRKQRYLIADVATSSGSTLLRIRDVLVSYGVAVESIGCLVLLDRMTPVTRSYMRRIFNPFSTIFDFDFPLHVAAVGQWDDEDAKHQMESLARNLNIESPGIPRKPVQWRSWLARVRQRLADKVAAVNHEVMLKELSREPTGKLASELFAHVALLYAASRRRKRASFGDDLAASVSSQERSRQEDRLDRFPDLFGKDDLKSSTVEGIGLQSYILNRMRGFESAAWFVLEDASHETLGEPRRIALIRSLEYAQLTPPDLQVLLGFAQARANDIMGRNRRGRKTHVRLFVAAARVLTYHGNLEWVAKANEAIEQLAREGDIGESLCRIMKTRAQLSDGSGSEDAGGGRCGSLDPLLQMVGFTRLVAANY
jgi:orotate phosphoribosyltransferase